MVLELSGTRSEAGPAFSAETAAVVRARLGGAIPEMIDVIGRGVPEYASQARPDDRQRLADAVTGAVASFIAHVAQPDRPIRPVLEEFQAIGATAARDGRTLDGLQDALRLGARVAWRWLCEAGAALDRRELSRVGEAVFCYLDDLAAACARGYAEARVQATGDQHRQLLALILADPPPPPAQVATVARAAGWPLPAHVAAVLRARPDTLLLPRRARRLDRGRSRSCCRPACSPTGPLAEPVPARAGSRRAGPARRRWTGRCAATPP